jgi:ribosomal protein L37AE/L43A
MTDRMVPYFCPYCGDEDLRPSEAGHGTWECRSCARAFSVKFVGLLRNPATAPIAEEARS